LNGVLGGFQDIVASDGRTEKIEERKTILSRKREPVFDVIIEIVANNE